MGTKASAGRPRRVLIIVENLPVPFDRRVWQEAQTLRDAGYVVSVICPVGEGATARHEVLDDIHIYRYKLPFEARRALGYFIEYAAALFWQFVLSWRVLLSRGFDVIHACNPPDNIFLIGGFFKLFGKRFLFDHHDICPELYLAKDKSKDFFYSLLLAHERWTFRTANVCIATNESYRQIALQRGRKDPSRVFIVRSGPDLGRVKLVEPSPRCRNGRAFLVAYVGVMGRQEGIDYLLRSVRHILREMGRDDIHFQLVGSGPELKTLQDYSKELGVCSHVTFPGRLPDADLLEILSTADVCVNPDIANEMNDKSTMNKILEYMALGKPVVQFDLTEGRFSAGDASLYAEHNNEVDFAEKIVALIDDPQRRAEMGQIGRRRIEQELSWEHQAPQLLAAYEALWDGTDARKKRPWATAGH